MRVLFAPEARDEFTEAERYYDEQLPGSVRASAKRFVSRYDERVRGRYLVRSNAARFVG